jgi:hypothetical protein
VGLGLDKVFGVVGVDFFGLAWFKGDLTACLRQSGEPLRGWHLAQG